MVRIITDSSCDLDPALLETRGIQALPLKVYFGETCYEDGVNLSKAEFYRRLEAGTVPRTSQVTPMVFERCFRAAQTAGDEVVCILLSAALSGTCQSAAIARNLVGGQGIYVIDSRTVTGGLGHLVKVAADLRDRGCAAAEIADTIQRLIPRLRWYAVLDTLKYLKLGGRISGPAAVIGGVMGIRPVICCAEGEVRAAGKVRSQEAGRAWVLRTMEEHPPAVEYGLCFTYSGNRAALDAIRAQVLAQYPVEDSIECEIGAAVGTYAGPGAWGVMYIEAEDKA